MIASHEEGNLEISVIVLGFFCCLIWPNSLFFSYLLGRSGLLPNLGEVTLYTRCPIGHSGSLSSGHQGYIL